MGQDTHSHNILCYSQQCFRFLEQLQHYLQYSFSASAVGLHFLPKILTACCTVHLQDVSINSEPKQGSVYCLAFSRLVACPGTLLQLFRQWQNSLTVVRVPQKCFNKRQFLKGQAGFADVKEEDVSTEKLLGVSCFPICCVVFCHMLESMGTTQIICWY